MLPDYYQSEEFSEKLNSAVAPGFTWLFSKTILAQSVYLSPLTLLIRLIVIMGMEALVDTALLEIRSRYGVHVANLVSNRSMKQRALLYIELAFVVLTVLCGVLIAVDYATDYDFLIVIPINGTNATNITA